MKTKTTYDITYEFPQGNCVGLYLNYFDEYPQYVCEYNSNRKYSEETYIYVVNKILEYINVNFSKVNMIELEDSVDMQPHLTNHDTILFGSDSNKRKVLFNIRTSGKINILCSHDDKVEFVEFIKNVNSSIAQSNKKEINFIIRSSHGFDSERLTFNCDEEFSIDNYNEDFGIVDETIMESINKELLKGLILLHGGMGTGKTSYIKNIINKSDKEVYYIPPELTSSLSSPEFITFISRNLKNSILVIEDAENVLKHREAGGSQAVSNILNLTDGILGDIVNTMIICTFNSSIEEIDPALLRPGRLLASYHFDKLTEERTSFLVKKLFNIDINNESMSLAEIYNMKNLPIIKEKEKIKIGFV